MEIEGTGHHGGLQAPFDEPSASDVRAADEDTSRGRSSSAKKSGGVKASKKKAASDADGSESDKGAAAKHRRPRRPKGPRKGGGSKSHRHGGKGGRRAGHGHEARGSGGGPGRASKGRRDNRGPSSNGVAREESRNLPLVPAGEEGIIYVVGGFAPLAGEGYIEMYDRKRSVRYSYNYFTEEYEASEEINLVPVSTDRGLVNRLTDPLDRQIAAIITRLPKAKVLAANAASKKSRKGRSGRKGAPNNHYSKAAMLRSASCYVSEDGWRRLLPLLMDTGRVYVEHGLGRETMLMERETLGPFEFYLSLEFGSRQGDYHLTGRFVRDGRPLQFDAQALLVADGETGYLLRKSGRITEVDFKDSGSWLRALRRGRFQRVNKRNMSKIYKVFERSTTLPPLLTPLNLDINLVKDARPRPELKLLEGYQEAVCEVSFRYGDDDSVKASRPGRCFFASRTKNVVVRDRDAETEKAVQLMQMGFAYNKENHQFTLEEERLPFITGELFERGWAITGKEMPFRPPTDMEVNVKTEPDPDNKPHNMTVLSVTVHFEDQEVGLPALLGAIHGDDRMIPLGRGAIGVLPMEWLDKNAAWMELGELRGESLIFRENQSPVVDALLADNVKAKLDDEFKAERVRLEGFKGVEACEPTEEFKGELRGYQKIGLGWLRFLDQMAMGGCLADDMGLGKTAQALAIIDLLKKEGREGPSLVVCPKSLIFNWLREIKKFTPHLKGVAYTGPKRSALFEKFDDYDIILTTYGTLRRDIGKLVAKQFFYVILDEGQAIKNPDSQNAKSAMLLQGERRLILSGTPIENHLGELWSLYQFLNPRMLGSESSFKTRYGSGIDADSSSLSFLRKTLRPFILRRKKEEVATDLPEKIEETITCEMEAEQKKVYNKIKRRVKSNILGKISQQGMGRTKLHILEALLRLRQAACHPALIDDEYADHGSGKFKVLLSMLNEVEDEGHKVLIFSQFTSLLALLRNRLDEQGKVYEYLDGKTTNREGRVDRFQNDPNVKFFLISLKAGGVGLNLTAADYVFILDPWWNPAVEAQAIDRAHRIGQDKKVFAYRFVSGESIEERIADLQESKRKLADSIVTGSDSVIRDLTKEDLEYLFK